MAGAIQNIRADLEAYIETITPDYLGAEIPFRLAPKGRSWLDLVPNLAPDESTRLYMVAYQQGVGFTEWNGNLSHVTRVLEVQILYRVPRLDDGADVLIDMIAVDEDRLAHAINKPDINPAPWGAGSPVDNIESTGLSSVLDLEPDMKILVITFRVDYHLGDDPC